MSVSGLPEGVSHSLVDSLCQAYVGSPLRSASYVHRSGWKYSGAYKLTLHGENGRSGQFFFKKAIYDKEEIPALEGLPLKPGLPEYLVYKQGDELLPYLPQVYLCAEITPGHQYHYLLEDLSQTHKPLCRNQSRQVQKHQKSILHAVAELPYIHGALRSWVNKIEETSLLQYDYIYSNALRQYAQANLEQYTQKSTDPVVSTLLKKWDDISAIFDNDEFHDPKHAQPVHGDYHCDNIYRLRGKPHSLKLIDWEWAGYGKPHRDLATLLNRARPGLEKKALAIYALRESQYSLEQHHRFYEWCQLERGLLDCAFLARQSMFSNRRREWIPPFIQRSAERVQLACARLSGGVPLVN